MQGFGSSWGPRILELSECLLSGLSPSADIGCVVRPVSAAGALPLDRDADVDSEHASHQRRRQVNGELEQCGGARQSG